MQPRASAAFQEISAIILEVTNKTGTFDMITSIVASIAPILTGQNSNTNGSSTQDNANNETNSGSNPQNMGQSALRLLCLPAPSQLRAKYEQQGAVRCHFDIPQSTVGAIEQSFLVQDPAGVGVHIKAREQLEFQRSDNQVAVPLRKHFSAIHLHSARCDRGVPIVNRLHHSPRLACRHRF